MSFIFSDTANSFFFFRGRIFYGAKQAGQHCSHACSRRRRTTASDELAESRVTHHRNDCWSLHKRLPRAACMVCRCCLMGWVNVTDRVIFPRGRCASGGLPERALRQSTNRSSSVPLYLQGCKRVGDPFTVGSPDHDFRCRMARRSFEESRRLGQHKP